ncbi:MAG: hypothetical protein KC422_01115 [Trueperaceae bacterium]|nr:hypothetical protein [Trueperaceae bacterium]
MERLLLFVLLFSLVSCIPQVNSSNKVLVVNAPTETSVSSIAPEVISQLSTKYASPVYKVIPDSVSGFAEGHTDLFGSRAVLNTSSTANRLGAEVAVMVSAPLFDREVKLSGSGADERRKVSTRVQVQVTVLDPVGQEELSSYKSAIFTSFRSEVTSVPLPALDEDPDMQKSLDAALADLIPQLAQDLDYVFQKLSPEVSN